MATSTPRRRCCACSDAGSVATLLRALRRDGRPAELLEQLSDALLANEEDVERLVEVGELMVDRASPEELPQRGNGPIYRRIPNSR